MLAIICKKKKKNTVLPTCFMDMGEGSDVLKSAKGDLTKNSVCTFHKGEANTKYPVYMLLCQNIAHAERLLYLLFTIIGNRAVRFAQWHFIRNVETEKQSGPRLIRYFFPVYMFYSFPDTATTVDPASVFSLKVTEPNTPVMDCENQGLPAGQTLEIAYDVPSAQRPNISVTILLEDSQVDSWQEPWDCDPTGPVSKLYNLVWGSLGIFAAIEGSTPSPQYLLRDCPVVCKVAVLLYFWDYYI